MIAEADGRALAVFSPDSTRTRRYRVALEALRSLGLVPASYRWVRPSVAQVGELYAENRAANRSGGGGGGAGGGSWDRDRLVDDLFTSDWSLACVLEAPGLRGWALAELLSVLKGPADPVLVRPGHLRWLLGAENLVMNGIHVADSPEHAVREATVLGLDRLGAPAHAGARGEQPGPGSGPEDREPPDLGWTRSSSALHVGSRLRRQLLDGAVEEPTPRLLALLGEEDDLAGTPHKPVGVLSRLDAVRDEQHTELRRLGVASDTVALAADVAQACTRTFDLAPVEAGLAGSGIAVDAWDRLVLSCQRDQGALPRW